VVREAASQGGNAGNLGALAAPGPSVPLRGLGPGPQTAGRSGPQVKKHRALACRLRDAKTWWRAWRGRHWAG
jgi:hypothetical protein